MIKGYPKVDAIVVGEFTVSFVGPTLDFKAKAAFVNSKDGQTHGWTTNQTWSPPVLEKLRELRMLMEVDLGGIHFDNGGELVASPLPGPRPATEPGGLGEHMGSGGIPQV
jgi:hypothetical protein